ncbi:MAG: hypothetical protein BWY31_00450 [Lentisphaerae bacterium ADurb.Bin242]|nr:MAG: hypothetical protein BWY31_00450 [Lentisphaerae bacterium ADurb.Bin242]
MRSLLFGAILSTGAMTVFCCNMFAAEPPLQKIDLAGIKICIPAAPSKTEVFAAGELRQYIGKMTGREVPVIREAEGPGKEGAGNGFTIFLGKTVRAEAFHSQWNKEVADCAQLEENNDSFVIDIGPGAAIFVGGGDRGTLYSVYEFLEKCGVRWYFPGAAGEVIPALKSITLPAGTVKNSPAFIQRELHISPNNPFGLKEAILWSARNRLNCNAHIRPEHLKELSVEDRDLLDVLRMQKWQSNVHNFDVIISSDKYFSSHPEYFALYKGKRIPQDTPTRITWHGGNLCLTNPDVIDLCSQFAMDWFDKHPDGLVVPMWPMDGNIKWCECAECSKYGGINDVEGEQGSMTRRLVVFVNEVARRVGRKHPGKFILMPSYHEYKKPVTDIPLEKNIVVQLCLHVDYARSIDKTKSIKSIERNRDLLEWRKAARCIGVWEYFMLGKEGGWENGKWKSATGDEMAWLPVLYRIRDMFRYLNDNGVKWYYTQANNKYWKHNTFQYYLCARMLWNPRQNFDVLLDDYCRNMYGNAAPYVKNIFLAIENAVEKSDWVPDNQYKDIVEPSGKVYTPQVIAAFKDNLNRAKNAGVDRKQMERIRILEETFNYINW